MACVCAVCVCVCVCGLARTTASLLHARECGRAVLKVSGITVSGLIPNAQKFQNANGYNIVTGSGRGVTRMIRERAACGPIGRYSVKRAEPTPSGRRVGRERVERNVVLGAKLLRWVFTFEMGGAGFGTVVGMDNWSNNGCVA